MAVSRAKKSELLAQLEALLKEAECVGFVSTERITVKDVETMKKDVRGAKASYLVAKKTLIRIAMKNVFGAEINIDTLPGQVAVVVSRDSVSGLGAVNKHAKAINSEKGSSKKLTFVGGYFEGKVLSGAEATSVADMPSREALLSRLLGSMKSPLGALARFMDAAGKELTDKSLSKVGDLVKKD